MNCALHHTLRLRSLRSVGMLITLMALAWFAAEAQATVFYPDVMGETVWFKGISENSKPDGKPEPLYGEPTVIVDTLDFNPNAFDFIASSNDASVDTIDGALSLMIEAKPGNIIHSLDLNESGFVNLFSLDGDPFAAVSGLLQIPIDGIDGMPITPFKIPDIMPTFTPSGGDFQHSVDADSPLFSSPWSGSASASLEDILIENQIPHEFGVTKITIEIDNILLAAAGGVGSLASIDKKDFSISVDTGEFRPVPEPAAFVLALSCLVGGIALKRRNSS